MDDPATPGRVHVAVRLDVEQAAEVDALIPTLSTSWHRATRSDALRLVVIEGLAALKRERSKLAGAPPQAPRGKGSRRRAGAPATSTAPDSPPAPSDAAGKPRGRA